MDPNNNPGPGAYGTKPSIGEGPKIGISGWNKIIEKKD